MGKWIMARDHQHNPDPNVNAAPIVSDSTHGEDSSRDVAAGLLLISGSS